MKCKINFVTLYRNNFFPSSCVVYIDLSSFSFPLLNFFLVNYFMFSSARLLRRPIRAPDQIPDRFYVINMEFLSLSRGCLSWRNVLSYEEQEETAVFAG